MSELPASFSPARLRRLLRRMIDIYSPSGKEEDLLEYLYGWLKRRGLPVVRQPVDERRYNLVVMPPQGEALLCLVGHVDTVSAFDLEDLGCREEGDDLIGLGAADMKGGCAAMCVALAALADSGQPWPPVALALVVGEEEDGDGARALVDEYHFPWAVIGEPTDLAPCLSHYGYLEVEVEAAGRSRHASLARPQENPVQALLALLSALSRHLDQNWPLVVYNLRDLTSWPQGFVMPRGAQAWLDLHLPPSTPLEEVAAALEEVAAAVPRPAELAAHLRLHTVQAGYQLPAKGPVVQALEQALAGQGLAWRPQAFPSHSDANLLWAAGTRPLLLGCGSLAMAHIPEEKVAFSQVLQAALIYHDLATSLAQ